MQLVKNEPLSAPDLLDEASAWIVRLSSDCVNENDLQEFSLWIAKGDVHKSAYDDMLDVWQDLGAVKHLPIEIPSPQQTVPQPKPSKQSWPAVSALAASLVLAIIISPNWLNKPEPQFYSTAVGQQQIVQLDEGSSITLNTNTRLEVSLTKDQRSIHLHSGEAFFEVAKDLQRPFIVNSCYSEVRALGTAFNVRCDRVKGVVTVTEGLIQVSGTNTEPNKADRTLVEVGQSVNIDEKLGISDPQKADGQRITSWRQGQFVFENTPLSEVIEEANRYSGIPIRLGSPELSHLQVTGRFELTDTKTLVAALEHSLSLSSVTREDKSIILN